MPCSRVFFTLANDGQGAGNQSQNPGRPASFRVYFDVSFCFLCERVNGSDFRNFVLIYFFCELSGIIKFCMDFC
jgi:hypothetical protein